MSLKYCVYNKKFINNKYIEEMEFFYKSKLKQIQVVVKDGNTPVAWAEAILINPTVYEYKQEYFRDMCELREMEDVYEYVKPSLSYLKKRGIKRGDAFIYAYHIYVLPEHRNKLRVSHRRILPQIFNSIKFNRSLYEGGFCLSYCL